MTSVKKENVAEKAVQFVMDYFVTLKPSDRDKLPSVLRSQGGWMASYDDATIGIFYLNNDTMKRVAEYQQKGWPPFPGFIVSEGKKPDNYPVAISTSGTCNVFMSNRTNNMIAFSVKSASSFMVVDHFHEIKDSSGEEFRYKVDLAFVIGIHDNEEWNSVEARLLELLNYSLRFWSRIR